MRRDGRRAHRLALVTPVQRRRLALLAAALAALAAGIVVGARDGRDAAPAGHTTGAGGRAAARAGTPGPRRLPLARAAGQAIVLRFAGTTAPRYVLDALRADRVSGVILFADNVASPAQVRRLTASLARAAGGRPPLICVDQEGGAVRILPWAPPAASAARQAAEARAGADARAAARALRSVGVSVSLAPVADVPSVAGSAMASRAFAGDAGRVSRSVAAAVRGWRAGGLAPTVKHFPGLGGAAVNTDFGAATVARSRAALLEEDLAPFAAAVAAGVPLVMVGHAAYPALDPHRIASQSPVVLRALLRKRLKFAGVAMTDSLEAEAVRSRWSVTRAAERSLRAGADLALTTGRGSYTPVHRHLVRVARRDGAFAARLREAAARVLALRASLR
jgi:beta-N-acetylhexosaminidase